MRLAFRLLATVGALALASHPAFAGPPAPSPGLPSVQPGAPVDMNTVLGRANAARAKDAVNALDYGCDAIVNTTADAAPCMSSAAAAAKAQGKHFVFVPGGSYTFGSAVTGLNAGIQFRGDGWDEAFTLGTRFLRSATGFVPFAFTSYKGGFEGIAFADAQPTPSATTGTAWAPTPYGPWATVQNGNIVAKNIFFYGVTAWAQMGKDTNTASGRNEFDGIYGQVFNYALDFEVSADSSRVSNFHMWPFYSQNGNVYDYTLANTTPIISRRNDNPNFVNAFSFGTKTLIWFDSTAAITPGITSKAAVVNSDCDSCLYPIYITGNGTSVQFANWRSQASPLPGTSTDTSGKSITGSTAAYIPANQTVVSVNGWNAREFGLQILNITGTNNVFNYTLGQFINWGYDGGTVYAMTAAAGQGNSVVGYSSSFQSPASGGTNYNSGTYLLGGPGTGAGSYVAQPFSGATAAGTNAASIMTNCAATANNSLCAATQGSASAVWGAVFGFATIDPAGGQFNTVFGYLTTSRGVHGGVFGSGGPFAASGDNEWSIRNLRTTTTGATTGRLTDNGGAASTSNTLNLPLVATNGLAYGFSRFAVVAFDKTNILACMWYVDDLLVKRSATAGSTSIVGSPAVSLSKCDQALINAGLSAASLSVSADTTNDGVNLTLAGVAGYNLHISANPIVTEVQ